MLHNSCKPLIVQSPGIWFYNCKSVLYPFREQRQSTGKKKKTVNKNRLIVTSYEGYATNCIFFCHNQSTKNKFIVISYERCATDCICFRHKQSSEENKGPKPSRTKPSYMLLPLEVPCTSSTCHLPLSLIPFFVCIRYPYVSFALWVPV